MSPPSTPPRTSLFLFHSAFLFARTASEPVTGGAVVDRASGVSSDSTDMRADKCALTEKVEIYPGDCVEGPVTNVYSSWKKASEVFTQVLAAEAASETNNFLSARTFASTNQGVPPFDKLRDTALRATIRVAANGPYDEDMFELRLQRLRRRDDGPNSTKTSTSPHLTPWISGQVVIIRFDLCDMWKQTRDSKKRSRDDEDEIAFETQSRVVYRHALATGPSSLRFILSIHHVNLKDILFKLGAQSGYEIPLGRSSPCGVRCYEPVGDISSIVRQVKAIDGLSSASEAFRDFLVDPRSSWQWSVCPGPHSTWPELSTRCTPAQSMVVTTVATRLLHKKMLDLMPGVHLPESHSWEWLSSKASHYTSEPACIAVQGPPGTGKSTLLVEVLKSSLRETAKQFEDSPFLKPLAASSKISSGIFSRYAARSQPRILVSAPTNQAVDELLERVVTDPDFATISNPFRQCSLESDLDDAHTVSSAVSSVLRSCLVVRVGYRSVDSRSAVKSSMIDAVVTNTRNSARASHAGISSEIDRLQNHCEKRTQRIQQLKSLRQKVEVTQAAGERGEAHPVTVDGEPCFLSGDFGQAVQYFDNEIARHTSAIEKVEERIGLLKRERKKVENLFASFLHDSESDESPGPPYSDLEGFVLANAVCVFATCDGAGSSMMMKCREHTSLGFDLLLIDEAARASIPQLLVPLSQCNFGRRSCDLVAVGDPAQNAATVISEDKTVQKVLGCSLLERSKILSDAEETPCWLPFRLNLLDIQFRLNPDISKFVRAAFYDSRVSNGLPDTHFQLPWHLEEESVTESQSGAAGEWYKEGCEGISGKKFGPLILADTAAEANVSERTHSTRLYHTVTTPAYPGSRGNLGEAMFVVKMLSFVMRRLTDLKEARDVERWCSLSGDRDRTPTVLIQTTYKLQERIISEMLALSDHSEQTNMPFLERIATLIDGGADWVQQWRNMHSEIEALKQFFSIHVLTIDCSIGREVDIAFVSRVAPESESGVGFLACPKRLCVSLTRASSLLVVVGPTKLAEGRINTKWDQFAQHCKIHKHIWPVSLLEKDLDTFLSL